MTKPRTLVIVAIAAFLWRHVKLQLRIDDGLLIL